jgi:hypothetical protein
VSIATEELIRILQNYPDCELAACSCAEDLLITDKHGHEVRKIPLTSFLREEEREMYGRRY